MDGDLALSPGTQGWVMFQSPQVVPPRMAQPRAQLLRAPTVQHRAPPVRTLCGQPPHVPQLSIVRTDTFSMKPGFQPSIHAGDQFLWRCHRLEWCRAVGPAECNFRNLRKSAASADKPRVMGPPFADSRCAILIRRTIASLQWNFVCFVVGIGVVGRGWRFFNCQK